MSDMTETEKVAMQARIDAHQKEMRRIARVNRLRSLSSEDSMLNMAAASVMAAGRSK